MKKFLNKFYTLATLLIASAAFTACSSDSDITGEDNNENGAKTYSLKIGVLKNGDATRALKILTTPNSEQLMAYWKTDENIYVYDENWNKFNGQLNPDDNGKTIETVSGTLVTTGKTAELAAGSKINLVFPRITWDYTGQDGKLETLATKYDYATATTTIKTMSGNNITETNDNPVPFYEQQAIVKIKFVDGSGADINPTQLKIHDSEGNLVQKVSSFNNGKETKGDLTINLDGSSSTCYVAMRGVLRGSTLTMTAKHGNITSIFNITLSQSLENGKYYELTFRPDDALTVEAQVDNTPVSFNNNATGPVTCKVYNADGTLKATVTAPAGQRTFIATLAKDEKVIFFGNNATYTSYTSGGSETSPNTTYSTILIEDDGRLSGSVSSVNWQTTFPVVYGNVMSLINGEDYATATTLTEGAALAGLFKNSWVTSSDRKESTKNKQLLLPATTLTQGCYQQMFFGAKLTKAPALPATTLQPYCYEGMFEYNQFTTAPNLIAEHLVTGCYYQMFRNCGKLDLIKCFANSKEQGLFNNCTENWVANVASSGVFYIASSYAKDIQMAANKFNTTDEIWASFDNGTGSTYMIQEEGFWGKEDTDHSIWWAQGSGGIPSNWAIQQE